MNSFRKLKPFLILIFATILGLVAAICLSYIYQLVQGWNPFLVLSIFLMVGFAAALCAVTTQVLNLSKISNPLIGALLGLIIGFAGIGGKFWIQYEQAISAASAELASEFEFDSVSEIDIKRELRQEVSFFNYLQQRASAGMGISRRGRSLPISGSFIYLLWALEALFVCFISLGSGLVAAEEGATATNS